MATTVNNAAGILQGVTTGTLTSAYGPRTYTIGGKRVSDNHRGIDLKPIVNVCLPERGLVIQVVNNVKAAQTPDIIANKIKSLYSGNLVKVRHGNCDTFYCHFAEGSVTPKVGDILEKGTVIGKIGSTGYSTGPHLHFAVIINNVHVDPLPYFTGQKKIEPYSVTAADSRPELPTLKANVTGIRYRDAANGSILGYLTQGTSYPFVGRTKPVNRYEWAQIIVNDKIVYAAINPEWNELKDIGPKYFPFEKQIEVGSMLLSVSFKEKP